MAAVTLKAIVAALTSGLQYVAPFVVGVGNLGSQKDVPRYVLIRKGGGKGRTQSINGSSGRVIRQEAYDVEIRCEGATEDDAEAMRWAVMSALRTILNGANCDFGDFEWIEPKSAATRGAHCLSQKCTLFVEVPWVDIPTSAPTPPAAGDVAHPSATVLPMESPYVVPPMLQTITPEIGDVDPPFEP